MVDVLPVAQEDVRSLHRHTAEVGNKMGAVRVTGDVALRTAASVLTAKREHITTVTAPVRTDVGNRLEAMGNAVVDFLRIVVLTGSDETAAIDSHLPYLPQCSTWIYTL